MQRPIFIWRTPCNYRANSRDALTHYQAARQQKPQWIPPANNLAWLLATHPDDQIRNGPEAVRIAEQVCQATRYQDPTTVATLAAALAEVGRYSDAEAMNEKAIQLLIERGAEDAAKQLQLRQQRYQSQQPYRDP